MLYNRYSIGFASSRKKHSFLPGFHVFLYSKSVSAYACYMKMSSIAIGNLIIENALAGLFCILQLIRLYFPPDLTKLYIDFILQHSPYFHVFQALFYLLLFTSLFPNTLRFKPHT